MRHGVHSRKVTLGRRLPSMNGLAEDGAGVRTWSLESPPGRFCDVKCGADASCRENMLRSHASVDSYSMHSNALFSAWRRLGGRGGGGGGRNGSEHRRAPAVGHLFTSQQMILLMGKSLLNAVFLSQHLIKCCISDDTADYLVATCSAALSWPSSL